MPYHPEIHNRRSIRMPGYDYASAGWYFVTLCVYNRQPVLAVIRNEVPVLTDIGRDVNQSWQWLCGHYDHVRLDSSIIMPNHFHGIIVIQDSMDAQSCRGGSRTALLQTDGHQKKRKSLGRLIGAFKTHSTKLINEKRHTPGARFWQRNYYEHIIRNEKELARIRAYIDENPRQWAADRYFLDSAPVDSTS